MSAVEEIQTAREKLTALRGSANDAQWLAMDSDVVLGDPSDPVEAYPLIAECNCDADAELIAVLHRPIDAQLAVLDVAHTFATITPNRFTDAGLELARAINGTTPLPQETEPEHAEACS